MILKQYYLLKLIEKNELKFIERKNILPIYKGLKKL